MKVSYIFFALFFIVLAYSSSKYYGVYLNTAQYLHEFNQLEYPNNPELETDIKDVKVFSHEDTGATLLFIRTSKEQYFARYKREGASDITKRFGEWELAETEKVRDAQGNFIRYYFPIYL